MVDVIIPTIKSKADLFPMIREMENTAYDDLNVIVTGFQVSASVNRNYGLERAKGESVIMLDDDVCGFPSCWDDQLVASLEEDVVMVSARLLKPDGQPGTMVGDNYDMKPGVVEVVQRQLPTACIAFRNDGTRFDPNFVGSGFEDNDFCIQLRMKYPKGRFVINNDVEVIHKNEMKAQGENWERNQNYIRAKWGIK